MVIAAQYLMKLKMNILKATRAVFSKFEISGNNKRMNHIKQSKATLATLHACSILQYLQQFIAS
jgi:hypothetical protein